MVNMSVLLFLFLLYTPCAALAAHGVSIDNSLKYPPDFVQFDYTSPKAKKGGKLVLHDIGSFDKMNPFTRKGTAPYGLETLVFEPLAVSSLDEPFAVYGLIAEDIELAANEMSVIFTLNKNAKFSDGSPVTVDDVAYTLAIFKSDKVHPAYPYYYRDISGSEIVGENKIKFLFANKNRELHLIASQIPILSKKFFEITGFGDGDRSDDLLAPVGSGPYTVSDVSPGKTITYKKNENYWAKDSPCRKGMFNFDNIVVKYYKDQTVALEAYKAGEFDFISINIAKQWARDMKGSKFSSGKIIKKNLPHFNNAGMQGFLMNTRRDLFKDRRVRQALGLALDFEWINRSLFYGQYTRTNSFFSNSPLAATGLPQGLELEYLNKFRGEIPEEVFTQFLSAPRTVGKYGIRTNLKKARKLLVESGWSVKNGILTNEEGKHFEFDILLVTQSFERVMASYVSNLKKLGIKVRYRTIDPALYTERLKNFDFDMIVTTYGQSLSPGNEQRNYWQSTAATVNGSKNYAGVKSAAIDSLVDKIIYAANREQLTAACKALDRVLWYGYYLVPNWYLKTHRVSYYNKFLYPEKLPLYYHPFQLLMTWWQ
ncbi:MAG: ABC transporter substrate-binding protein [Deltaproteobacteria bacterium]|nr:ABC transporter substrate-binding protein [Deltaproteobacteria bacterium]